MWKRSVIVDDLDVVCVSVSPPKADAPLIVDADAVLPLSVAAQCLEPIAGRGGQILDDASAVQIQELPTRLSFDRAKPRHKDVIEQLRCIAVLERSDHSLSILRVA